MSIYVARFLPKLAEFFFRALCSLCAPPAPRYESCSFRPPVLGFLSGNLPLPRKELWAADERGSHKSALSAFIRVHRRLNMFFCVPRFSASKYLSTTFPPWRQVSQPIPPRFVRGVELCASLCVSASAVRSSSGSAALRSARLGRGCPGVSTRGRLIQFLDEPLDSGNLIGGSADGHGALRIVRVDSWHLHGGAHLADNRLNVLRRLVVGQVEDAHGVISYLQT